MTGIRDRSRIGLFLILLSLVLATARSANVALLFSAGSFLYDAAPGAYAAWFGISTSLAFFFTLGVAIVVTGFGGVLFLEADRGRVLTSGRIWDRSRFVVLASFLLSGGYLASGLVLAFIYLPAGIGWMAVRSTVGLAGSLLLALYLLWTALGSSTGRTRLVAKFAFWTAVLTLSVGACLTIAFALEASPRLANGSPIVTALAGLLIVGEVAGIVSLLAWALVFRGLLVWRRKPSSGKPIAPATGAAAGSASPDRRGVENTRDFDDRTERRPAPSEA